jgi:hypothetical protein
LKRGIREDSANAAVKHVYQFRISLPEVEPPVWRRFEVPAEYTLARQHKVIQPVMDWQDYHLDEFTVSGWRSLR